jgi:hypothetical protein
LVPFASKHAVSRVASCAAAEHGAV